MTFEDISLMNGIIKNDAEESENEKSINNREQRIYWKEFG